MIHIRKFSSLGAANHGWLDAHHHFSFANYHDPNRMGWGRIRVWNDDWIAPGQGFHPHAHSDMEIITYVRKGAITHQDNLGNTGRTLAGDVQVMSAGSGVVHSEFNLEDDATEIFQIWVMPDKTGRTASWDTRPFPKGDRTGQWVTLANLNGTDGALPIRADARVLGATVRAGETLDLMLGGDRVAYLVPSAGAIAIGDVIVNARDGVAIADETRLSISAIEDSEIILVETRK